MAINITSINSSYGISINNAYLNIDSVYYTKSNLSVQIHINIFASKDARENNLNTIQTNIESYLQFDVSDAITSAYILELCYSKIKSYLLNLGLEISDC